MADGNTVRTVRARHVWAGVCLLITVSGVQALRTAEAVSIDKAATRSIKSVAVLPRPSTPRPTMIDPLRVVIDGSRTLRRTGDYDGVGCDGYVYEVTLPAGSDAIVTMGEGTAPLEYPVWITGGRNVLVLGLELRPVVQPGCGIGEATQVRDTRANIHPRLVGNKAFRLMQSGTTYIEGVDIDLAGQEADCFAVRNVPGMTREAVKRDRDVVIANTRCTGIEGLDKSAIGDGIHGDFVQNQGRGEDMGSLVLENVTYLSSSNGITLHQWNGAQNRPRQFSLINVNYAWDMRYVGDDRYENHGLAFIASADEFDFDNVWIDDGRGLNYGMVNGERYGAFEKGGHVERHPGLNAGAPRGGDFAPASLTGIEYRYARWHRNRNLLTRP